MARSQMMLSSSSKSSLYTGVLMSVIYFKAFQPLQYDITRIFLKLSQNPGANQEKAAQGPAVSITSERTALWSQSLHDHISTSSR